MLLPVLFITIWFVVTELLQCKGADHWMNRYYTMLCIHYIFHVTLF